MIYEDFSPILRLLRRNKIGGGYSKTHDSSRAARAFADGMLPKWWDLPEPYQPRGVERAASLARDPSDGSYAKA